MFYSAGLYQVGQGKPTVWFKETSILPRIKGEERTDYVKPIGLGNSQNSPTSIGPPISWKFWIISLACEYGLIPP